MKSQTGDFGDLFDLSGKVVIYAGSAGQMGPSNVEVFARAGAVVIALDVLSAKLNEAQIKEHFTKKGLANRIQQVHYIKIDICDENQNEKLVSDIVKEFGHIDVLANAAVLNPGVRPQEVAKFSKPFELYPLEMFRRGIEVSLTGPVALTKAVVGQMLKQKGDRNVIFFASTYGHGVPKPELYKPGPNKAPWYGAAKAALIYMSNHLAREYGKRGIRFNVIVPGGVHTNEAKSFNKRYSKFTPLGRMAQRNEYQRVLLTMATTPYMTGSVIAVDGGWTIR